MEMLALLAVFVAGYLVSWIQWYQPEQKKAQALARGFAQVSARMLDLEFAQKKGSGQDLPQHQNSYWRFEGPKLQARVLDLEMQLEQLRSKTLWRQD
jgi:hypothetical protein